MALPNAKKKKQQKLLAQMVSNKVEDTLTG